jgi:hypothetical protein
MGAEGWSAIMEAAEGCRALTALDPLGAAWRELVDGELVGLDLKGNGDAGLAVACSKRYLGRSAWCLNHLDIR